MKSKENRFRSKT